mmetsp:Transcript_101227/g.290455  ORF Transcript_101227/g.290455 Transcript_101227/m.290455 type:complete len:204 (+) Transcript_101227:191-802(+)
MCGPPRSRGCPGCPGPGLGPGPAPGRRRCRGAPAMNSTSPDLHLRLHRCPESSAAAPARMARAPLARSPHRHQCQGGDPKGGPGPPRPSAAATPRSRPRPRPLKAVPPRAMLRRWAPPTGGRRSTPAAGSRPPRPLPQPTVPPKATSRASPRPPGPRRQPHRSSPCPVLPLPQTREPREKQLRSYRQNHWQRDCRNCHPWRCR